MTLERQVSARRRRVAGRVKLRRANPGAIGRPTWAGVLAGGSIRLPSKRSPYAKSGQATWLRGFFEACKTYMVKRSPEVQPADHLVPSTAGTQARAGTPCGCISGAARSIFTPRQTGHGQRVSVTGPAVSSPRAVFLMDRAAPARFPSRRGVASRETHAPGFVKPPRGIRAA